jgi:hydroxymethylglutaryl-CoA reductase (NADPH)
MNLPDAKQRSGCGGNSPKADADRLAEIIAAGALAGELSLLGALASRHLSSAHEDLGR